MRTFSGKVGGVQYEVGLIGKVPIPNNIIDDHLVLLSKEASKFATFSSTSDECRHTFALPRLLAGVGNTLVERFKDCESHMDVVQHQLTERLTQLDEMAFRLCSKASTVQVHRRRSATEHDRPVAY